ncbi:MAG: hypothetical protein EZS28_028149 [Streblomastix strix]|uniref:Uncharacterized protein n=1 Tax=Streblomastix strix TaxID=222440 RepID=A0A5J4V1A8_9EUKA|nr:MAG: hypothetical protein EZS28_028148 [Streblomastix strix]KAA6376325.1 MAG: hypothetical protein EZS28_028149 [Streblomastix strix]
MYKHSQFINSLIEGLRCAGGNEEEYKSAIEQSIAVVREIYFKIINRVGIYSEFFELRKDFESQIEEFGDGEELESHLFHFIVLHESGVKEYAEDACSTITLAFKHPTNGNNLHDFDKIEKEELTYDEIDFEI